MIAGTIANKNAFLFLILVAAVFTCVSYITNHYTTAIIVFEAKKALKEDSSPLTQLLEYCDTAGGGKLKSFFLRRTPKLDSLEFEFEDEDSRSHYTKRTLENWMETFRFGSNGFRIWFGSRILEVDFQHSNYSLQQSWLVRANNLDSLLRFAYPDYQIIGGYTKQVSSDKCVVLLDDHWCLIIR